MDAEQFNFDEFEKYTCEFKSKCTSLMQELKQVFSAKIFL